MVRRDGGVVALSMLVSIWLVREVVVLSRSRALFLRAASNHERATRHNKTI